MEPKGSLRHSQVPATCPYPEPDQSCPYPNIPRPEDPFPNVTNHYILNRKFLLFKFTDYIAQ